MNSTWIAVASVVAVWMLVALLQLGDVATAFFDSRTARDRDVPGRIARERTNELFWIIPVGAIVALGVGVGVDRGARYLFGTGGWELGALFLLGLAVLVVGVGALTLAATAATDPVSYAGLRRDLRDKEGERITPKQLAEFRATLTRIDRRARSRMRPSSRLDRQTVLRLLPIIVGLLVVVAAWIADGVSPTSRSLEVAWISLLAPVLSALFAALGIRFALASDAAWRRVYARQRADIQRLLEEFDRATRTRVAGLRERVTRALKILGEQQS